VLFIIALAKRTAKIIRDLMSELFLISVIRGYRLFALDFIIINDIIISKICKGES
jgi:hypothetical protein